MRGLTTENKAFRAARPAAIGLALIELVLRQQEQPERVEPDIAQREFIALMILTELAGTAGRIRASSSPALKGLLT
jgi:hypothetical protein